MKRPLRALLSALFPQRTACHACGEPLRAGDGLLCPRCEASLRAAAFAPAWMETVVDAQIDCAASPFRYEGAAAALVRALKFGGDHTAALPLAEGLAAACAALPALRAFDLCVPVPLHYRRFRQRGYNQAEVLAAALCEALGLPPPVNALVRVLHRHSQVGQGREARRRNIEGAFQPGVEGAKAVRGRAVLLVDDVLTTGATAVECALALRAAGATCVLLLTACRA